MGVEIKVDSMGDTTRRGPNGFCRIYQAADRKWIITMFLTCGTFAAKEVYTSKKRCIAEGSNYLVNWN